MAPSLITRVSVVTAARTRPVGMICSLPWQVTLPRNRPATAILPAPHLASASAPSATNSKPWRRPHGYARNLLLPRTSRPRALLLVRERRVRGLHLQLPRQPRAFVDDQL